MQPHAQTKASPKASAAGGHKPQFSKKPGGGSPSPKPYAQSAARQQANSSSSATNPPEIQPHYASTTRAAQYPSPPAPAVETKDTAPPRPLYIYWDYYNAPLPTDFPPDVCRLIGTFVLAYVQQKLPGVRVTFARMSVPFRTDFQGPYQMQDRHRSQLESDGWRVNTFHKQGADDRILQRDMEMDSRVPGSIIVLIGSDGDFNDVLCSLHQNGVTTFVLYDQRKVGGFGRKLDTLGIGQRFDWEMVTRFADDGTVSTTVPERPLSPTSPTHPPASSSTTKRVASGPCLKPTHPEAMARMLYFIKFRAPEEAPFGGAKFAIDFNDKSISWQKRGPSTFTSEELRQYIEEDTHVQSARAMLEARQAQDPSFGSSVLTAEWAQRNRVSQVPWSYGHLLAARAPCIHTSISNNKRCCVSVEWGHANGEQGYVVTVATDPDNIGQDSADAIAAWYERTVVPMAQVWSLNHVQKAVLDLDETQELLRRRYGVRLSPVFINLRTNAVQHPVSKKRSQSRVTAYNHKDQVCTVEFDDGAKVENVQFAQIRARSMEVLASGFAVEDQNNVEEAYAALRSSWLSITTPIAVAYNVEDKSPRGLLFQKYMRCYGPRVTGFAPRAFAIEMDAEYSAVAARGPAPPGTLPRQQLTTLRVRGLPANVQRCVDWLQSIKANLESAPQNYQVEGSKLVIDELEDFLKKCRGKGGLQKLLREAPGTSQNDVPSADDSFSGVASDVSEVKLDDMPDQIGDADSDDGGPRAKSSHPLAAALFIEYRKEQAAAKNAHKLVVTSISHRSAEALRNAFWAKVNHFQKLRVANFRVDDAREAQLLEQAFSSRKKKEEFRTTYRLHRVDVWQPKQGVSSPKSPAFSVVLVGEEGALRAAKQQLVAIKSSMKQVERQIPCQYPEQMQLIPDEEFDALQEQLQKACPNVQVLRSPGVAVHLKGPKDEMDAAERIATEARDRWMADVQSCTLRLLRNEAQFLLSDALREIQGASGTLRVLFQDPAQSAATDGVATYAVAGSTDGAIRLEVLRAAVNQLPGVNVVMNAANALLQHAGGLAKAISDLAGPRLQDDCNTYIRQNGKLQTGGAYISDAYDLRNNGIERIVHVVPPTWVDGVSGENAQLRQAVRNALEAADSLTLNSVTLAIPAIGTGIYRLPAAQAIESIVHTVLLYLQENRPATKIDRIVFFDHDSSKADAFAQCLIATSRITTAPQHVAEALQVDYQWKWREDEFLESKGAANPREAATLQQAVYKDYDFNENLEIEQKYRKWQESGRDDSSLLYGDTNGTQNGFRYRIVFNTGADPHYQQNVDPRFMTKRRIVRVPVNPTTHQFQAMEKLTSRLTQMLRIQMLPMSAVDLDADKQAVVVSTYGRLRPSQLESCVRGFLDSERGSVDILLPGDDMVFDDLLHSKARVWLDSKPDGVVLSGTDTGRRILTIEGFPRDAVDGFARDLTYILKAELSTAEELQRKPPQEHPFTWQDEGHGKDGTAVLVDIPPNGDEWQQVLEFGRWTETMQRCQVTKIQRVENRALWDEYAHHRALMQRKRRTPWQTLHKWAWHGTRATNPQLIADNGVDFRYSDRGLWGRGAYTAHNASYSHGYASANPADGTRQMFLVNVMLGNTRDFGNEHQQELRMPPNGFDSVTGFTNGSVVHIVYETRQLYPAYLVSYKNSP